MFTRRESHCLVVEQVKTGVNIVGFLESWKIMGHSITACQLAFGHAILNGSLILHEMWTS